MSSSWTLLSIDHSPASVHCKADVIDHLTALGGNFKTAFPPVCPSLSCRLWSLCCSLKLHLIPFDLCTWWCCCPGLLAGSSSSSTETRPAHSGFLFLQVVQLHVGEEMQLGTFEGGAEEARGEWVSGWVGGRASATSFHLVKDLWPPLSKHQSPGSGCLEMVLTWRNITLLNDAIFPLSL